jgi:hypothetical protein
MMPGLPFTPFEHPLKDILRRRYISRAARWLLGKDPDTIPAQAGNSAWEAAFAIRFFANARDIFEEAQEEKALCDVIATKISIVVRWLISQQRNEGDNMISWEGVTWDTAIVTQALMFVSTYITRAELDVVMEAALKSCRWLLVRFQAWEQEKYPWGAADVAEILSTLVYLYRRYPGLYKQIDIDYRTQGELAAPALFRTIAEYLLQSCKGETYTTAEGAQLSTASWEDGFNTAAALSALGAYYSLLMEMYKVETHSQVAQDVAEKSHRQHLHGLREALVSGYQWFESQHAEDGTWGTTYDTAPILKVYVELPKLTELRRPNGRLLTAEPHFVFKTLRWLCDEKQIFWDGSFQHTDLTTIFYSSALISVYNLWEPAAQASGVVYDDVVWASPMRTAPERAQRLSLEVRALELEEQIETVKEERTYWQTKAATAERHTARIILIGLFTIFAVVASWIIAVDLRLLSTQVVPIQESDFLQFLGLALTIYTVVCTLIWNFPPLNRASVVLRRTKR